MNRAEKIVSNDSDRKREISHIQQTLTINGYPKWIFKKQRKVTDNSDRVPHEHPRSKKQRPVMLPYIKGVSEELRRNFKQFDIPVYFKPFNTLKQLLVHPKDKLDKERVVGPVYKITCNNCEAAYVGETERSLKARFMEHRRPSSTTSEVAKHIHQDQPGHTIDIDNTKVLTVEPRWYERGIKEAVNIRIHRPTLNKDGGRTNLPAVWTNLLHRHHQSHEEGARASSHTTQSVTPQTTS